MSAPTVDGLPYVVLFLAPEGTGITITDFRNEGEDPAVQQLQIKASACKTHKMCLALLLELQENPDASLIFYHKNNLLYDAHLGDGWKNSSHPCELVELISFVRYKILEERHGVRVLPRRCSACLLL